MRTPVLLLMACLSSVMFALSVPVRVLLVSAGTAERHEAVLRLRKALAEEETLPS